MMERVERDAILRALYDADRNRSRAAVALGISRSTLYRRLATYGLTSL
jgi:transcriptional regulator of acetoin/glycerol metabolism